MTLNLTNFNPMIKEHYAPGVVINMAYQKNKAMGLMQKRNRKPSGSGGGKYWVQPIQHSLPGGGSIDFATAMAATNNQSSYVAFQVTRKHHYRLAKVDNETIEATAEGDIDAFEPAFDEFDKAIQAEGNYLNFRLFRSAGASIGRMTNTNLATTIMTLDDAAGTWGVREGDVVNLSAANGLSGAVKVGSLTVASVQRRAGTVTFTANISTGVATAATNDFVFMAGDFGAGAVGTGAISGFIDWIPDADPTSTLFYGVDRTVEPEMLGGLRVDGTGGATVAEVLVDMVVQADNLGGDPDVCFANPRALGTMTKQLDGKWVIMKGQGYGGKEAEIGYKGWQVNLEGHEVTIFSDRCCQSKRLWMLDIDTWTAFSAGPAPMFLQKRAGSIIKVSENADAYEARIGEYINVACKAPGHNVNGQLA
jgi:hypothetical protein